MMRTITIGLLSLLWWSTAAAQSNAVSISKSCYITGEAFVASFTDASPKVRDWIGIIQAGDDVNAANVQYIQFVYTCGTSNCDSSAPASGTISIFNGLSAGKYKAVLLRSGTFQALAVSSSFAVAATCPASGGPTPTSNTVSVGKTCYISGEGVLASFMETKPQVGDRIGLILASANVNPTSGSGVFYPAVIFTCGTFDCSFAPARGSVSLFTNLSPGTYKAVLLQGSRLTPLAVSSNFVIAKVCSSVTPPSPPSTRTPTPPTRPPTLAPVRPTAPVATSSVSVTKSCFKRQSFVVVTFVDIGAQPGDRIGLVNATANVNANDKFYPSVIFTCGTFNCTTAPTSGSVSIFQNLVPGKYKAVLLRGKQLIALAVSTSFTIASTCAGPAPTPSPGHSVRVSKSCYLPAEAVITTFTDSDAQSGDRIGLIQSSADVDVFPVAYASVIFTCGTFTCTGAPTSGSVGIFQRFLTGQYKAVLLRGKQLSALAVSSNFNVSTTCNGVAVLAAPTPSPAAPV
jgi:hypothetical protein